MEGTLAEVRMFAGNFAPRGWQLCNGQLLSIAQWTAVFALVGTTYGGNGQTTFAIPDFRGRIALGTGTGPGLPSIQLGEVSGTENTTLIITNLPMHNHTLNGTVNMQANANGTIVSDGTNRQPGPVSVFSNGATLAPMASASANLAIGFTGANQPFNNRCPYIGINYIMCVEGIFPSRD